MGWIWGYGNIIFNLFVIITWNHVCEHQGVLTGLHKMSFIDLKKTCCTANSLTLLLILWLTETEENHWLFGQNIRV